MPNLKWKDIGVKQETHEQVPAFKGDIKGFDAIHALFVELIVRNVATGAPGTSPFTAFGSILVRGEAGTPYFAMSPLHAWKVAFYKTGKLPPLIIDHRGGAFQRVVVPILFGQSLADSQFYFPTANLNFAQVIVTAPNASGSGAFDPAQTTVRIWALVAQDGVMGPFSGFFATRAVGDVTLSGSGTRELSITRGPRYARFYLLYDHPTTNIDEGIGAVRLVRGVQTDQYSDVPAGLIRSALGAVYPYEATLNGVVLAANGNTYDLPLGNIHYVVVNNLQPEDATGDTLYTAKVTSITGVS